MFHLTFDRNQLCSRWLMGEPTNTPVCVIHVAHCRMRHGNGVINHVFVWNHLVMFHCNASSFVRPFVTTLHTCQRTRIETLCRRSVERDVSTRACVLALRSSIFICKIHLSAAEHFIKLEMIPCTECVRCSCKSKCSKQSNGPIWNVQRSPATDMLQSVCAEQWRNVEAGPRVATSSRFCCAHHFIANGKRRPLTGCSHAKRHSKNCSRTFAVSQQQHHWPRSVVHWDNMQTAQRSSSVSLSI